MKERDWIEPIVGRVVGRVLDNHMGQLRAEIIRQVVEEITAAPAMAGRSNAADSPSSPAELARAVNEIQMGSSQREILRALLEASSRYAARVALFVVKGSHAAGWQGRGFANDAALKDFALDDKAPAVVRAIGTRAVASVPVADQDPRFFKEFGAPASEEGCLLPLMLKDKVAALVYADSGTGTQGSLDSGALELLVLSTSAWLEVNSLRKQAQKEPSQSSASAAAADASPSPRVEAVSAFDPFASHSPGHAMAAAASTAVAAPTMEASAFATDPGLSDSGLAEPLPVSHTIPAPSETAPPAGISSEDQDVHRKAQRFARLLVDEIKLYNQAKVAEGRKNKDLYDRLKDTIDKSRITYQKRYGSTVAASGNYFHHEIIRSLAEDDLSIMGANFRQ
jgi:hypothetical protein